MKVSSDACLFGAWCAQELGLEKACGKKLLDIGTGTGLLSLMIAQKNSMVIDAVDIDLKAARQAQENIHAAKMANITAHHADILHFEKDTFEYIVSNPPFYENDLASPSLARSMAHHNRGLYWNDLLKIIDEKLLPEGKFFLLLPFKRTAEIDHLIQSHSFFINKKITVQHSPYHRPSRLMIKGSRKKTVAAEESLIIKDGENYSAAFIRLLQDYYLYL